MFEIATKIATALNVTSVKDIANGGVFALVAEERTENFITYSIQSGTPLTKDGVNRVQVQIGCYMQEYNDALKLHDQVAIVLKPFRAKLVGFSSAYLDETKECQVIGVFELKINL